MKASTGIIVALIGAATAITGAWFSATAAANAQVNDINTQVQVLKNTQALQYSELHDEVTTIQSDVKEILKAVK